MWHRTTAHQRGYDHRWRKLRQHVLDRDRGLCVICQANGSTMIATDVDHITPKAAGGSDDMSNLQSLCRKCHDRKTIEDGGGTVKATIGLDGWPIG